MNLWSVLMADIALVRRGGEVQCAAFASFVGFPA